MDVLSVQRAGGEDACGEVSVLRAETEVVVQEGGPVGSAGEGRNQHRGTSHVQPRPAWKDKTRASMEEEGCAIAGIEEAPTESHMCLGRRDVSRRRMASELEMLACFGPVRVGLNKCTSLAIHYC